jgi:hypothetical protein
MRRGIGLNGGFVGVDKRTLSEGFVGWEKNYLQNPTPTKLLDLISTNGLVGAWSMRKLRDGYTGSAATVRRSNDNATSNIGFLSNGDSDLPALASHVSSNSGFTPTVFDQGFNSRNLIQNSSGSQPRIRNTGTNETINSTVAIRGLNSSSTMIAANIGVVSTATLSLIMVTTLGSFVSGNRRLISTNFNSGGDGYLLSSAFNLNIGSSNSLGVENYGTNSFTLNANTPVVLSVVFNGSNLIIRQNGNQTNSFSNSNTIDINNLLLFNIINYNQAIDAHIGDTVLFSRALSTTELQLLERNMGAYYSITVA